MPSNRIHYDWSEVHYTYDESIRHIAPNVKCIALGVKHSRLDSLSEIIQYDGKTFKKCRHVYTH